MIGDIDALNARVTDLEKTVETLVGALVKITTSQDEAFAKIVEIQGKVIDAIKRISGET